MNSLFQQFLENNTLHNRDGDAFQFTLGTVSISFIDNQDSKQKWQDFKLPEDETALNKFIKEHHSQIKNLSYEFEIFTKDSNERCASFLVETTNLYGANLSFNNINVTTAYEGQGLATNSLTFLSRFLDTPGLGCARTTIGAASENSKAAIIYARTGFRLVHADRQLAREGRLEEDASAFAHYLFDKNGFEKKCKTEGQRRVTVMVRDNGTAAFSLSTKASQADIEDALKQQYSAKPPTPR